MSRGEENLPEDPFGGLAANSVQIHELYLSSVAAGFTPGQSMYMIGCLLTGSPGPSPVDGAPDQT